MITFAIAAIIVGVFLVSVVAVSLYIRPALAPRQMLIIKREPEQNLHDIIFASETADENCLLLTH
jgi:hypothetical protein